jgi:hypothetical protein
MYIVLGKFRKVTSITKCKSLLLLLKSVSVVLLYRLLVWRGNAICFIVFATQLLKLQPLDGSVQGHFEKRVQGGSGAWDRNNPGKIMEIYRFTYKVDDAMSNAFKPK